MTRNGAAVTVVVLAAGVLAPGAALGQQALPFTCDSVFTASTTANDLAVRYGSGNMVTAVIYLGEGFSETGTVLFPQDSLRRLEIVWKDSVAQERPRFVRVRAKRSAWRTAQGLTVGLRLKEVERLNRKPFRLFGFAFDGSGYVHSWADGRLEDAPSSTCSVRARVDDFVPLATIDRSVYNQVLGGREYSSGHPAMQEINPGVSEMLLRFDLRPGTRSADSLAGAWGPAADSYRVGPAVGPARSKQEHR